MSTPFFYNNLMQNFVRLLWIWLGCMFPHCVYSQAVSCSGTLGEPLVNITFGTGVDGLPDRPTEFTSQSLPLRVPGASTSYFHTPLQNQQFYEGTYALGYDIKFHNPYWRSFKGDHTGNPNGLMMIVNANPQPGIFYEQNIANLCTGVTYEFSAWIASIITDADGPSDEPVIEFRVENPNGTVLGTYTTPNVPRSFAVGLRLNWQRYAFLFVMPAGLSNVKLKMVNRRVGSAGNDLVIDDIQFRVCGPRFSIAANTLNACQGAEVLLTSTVGAGYNAPTYLWQVSTDGQNWTTIAGANAKEYKITSFPTTKQYYRTYAAEPQNISSPSCRVVSNVLEIQAKKKSVSNIQQTLCAGTSLIINGKTYNEANPMGKEVFKTKTGCDSVVNIALSFYPKIEINYQKTLCKGGSEVVNGKTYNEANPTGKEIFKTKIGCDSVVNVTLSFYPKIEVNYQKTLCKGSSEVVNGKIYNEANPTGKEIFKTKIGCDSVVNVALEFKATPAPTIIEKTICKGEKLIINGNVYDENRLSGNETLRTASGCDSLVSIRLKTFKASSITSNYNGFGTSCQGKNDGTIILTPSDGVAPYAILWSNGSMELNPKNLAAGNYAYLLTDQQGCQLTDTVKLTEPTQLTVATTGYGPLCHNQGAGGILVDNLSGGSGKYTYSINNEPFKPLKSPADSITGLPHEKTYTLLIKDNNGCSISKTVTIPNADSLKLAIEAPKVATACEQISLNVQASENIKTYQWTSNQALSCTDCANPWLTATTTAKVSLIAINRKGCKTQAAVQINVKPARLIFAPDVFTPNGDNINDSFYLFGSCDVKRVVSFGVYSRWGELIYFRENFQPNDPNAAWDGNYFEKGIVADTFVWKAVVEFTDESKTDLLRSVTLIK